MWASQEYTKDLDGLQKEREETFETQKALPNGLLRDKISMASEKKPGLKEPKEPPEVLN